MFELAAFAAAYVSFIASLFIVYSDSEEADPVALALGVFSCLDLGMAITGMFGNAVNRVTNNKKLIKYSSIMLCLGTRTYTYINIHLPIHLYAYAYR